MGLSSLLEAHRAKVKGVHRVRNAEGLVTMVDAFGFCFAFTLRTGDAPIPACLDHLSTNSEDRKWGWMWSWKDELPEEKRLYYGKLLVRKPTFPQDQSVWEGRLLPRLADLFEASANHNGRSDRLYSCANKAGDLLLKLNAIDLSGNIAMTQLDEVRVEYAELVSKYQENHEKYDYDLFKAQRSKLK